VWFASFPPVERRVRANGEGTIVVGSRPSDDRGLVVDASWPGGRTRSGAVELTDIPDADQVYRQIMARVGADRY
jgi:hypothetical protein